MKRMWNWESRHRFGAEIFAVAQNLEEGGGRRRRDSCLGLFILLVRNLAFDDDSSLSWHSLKECAQPSATRG